MRRICNENRCKYSENRRTNQIIIEKYLISNEKSGNEISLYGDEGHVAVVHGVGVASEGSVLGAITGCLPVALRLEASVSSRPSR